MGEILLDIEEKEIIEENEPVNIKIINNTNDDLTYKILVGKDGIWETLRDFQEKKELQWLPHQAGNYMIIVQAKKENSRKPFDFKVTQSITVGINEERLIKELNLNKDKLKVGEKVTLEVKSSKVPVMYRYFISGKDGWQLIKDYSTENKLNFTANEHGYFEFLIECKNPESSNSFDDYKTINFNVMEFKKPEIVDFKCLSEEILVGEDLVFQVTSAFEDERTALYKFVKMSPDGKAYCIQDYSSINMLTFIERDPGKYKLLCSIKDMYSSKEYDDRAMMVYEVKPYRPLQLKSFTTDLSSPQVCGTSVLLKTLIEGGNNLLYRFKIDGITGEDSGYTRNSTFIWDTKNKGDYSITLWAKDESYEGDYEVSATINYIVDEKRSKPVRITDVIFNKEKDYLINESINVKIITDGGTSLKYSFIISKNDEQKESIDYGDANWIDFIPRERGDYQLEVKVKDKYSDKEYDAHTVIQFKVKEYIEGKIEHVLVPSKGYFLVGDKVEVEAITLNTKETLIKYITKINDQIVEETDYIYNKKINILPKCSGKYIIEMYAKNIKCLDGFDTKREIKFYVHEALPVTNTKISTSKMTYKINEEINFTATSEGGSKVCYEYYIMINGNWRLMQKYSRKNYYLFRPFTPGNYRVLVLTKSHYKKCAYEDYDNFEFIVE